MIEKQFIIRDASPNEKFLITLMVLCNCNQFDRMFIRTIHRIKQAEYYHY